MVKRELKTLSIKHSAFVQNESIWHTHFQQTLALLAVYGRLGMVYGMRKYLDNDDLQAWLDY